MLFFFFKQRTAYEMRISDWSSDVCSSDLVAARRRRDDGVADMPVGFPIDRTAGIGRGINRCDHVGAVPLRQVDEGGHGGALAQVGGQGIGPVHRALRAKRGQRRGNRRKRIGFVIHTGNQDFHAASLSIAPTPATCSMACSKTLQPASRWPGCASSSSLWLMPSLQGTKIMAVGATRARYTASWPAPLTTGMTL